MKPIRSLLIQRIRAGSSFRLLAFKTFYRNSDHVALQAKSHGVAKVHKQCPVIINVKNANFTPDIATGCKVMTRSMTIIDSIRNGIRSYFMRQTKSSSPRLSLLSVT